MYSSLPLNALIRDRHRFFFITTTSLQYSIINLTISSSILASHHLLQKCCYIINIIFYKSVVTSSISSSIANRCSNMQQRSQHCHHIMIRDRTQNEEKMILYRIFIADLFLVPSQHLRLKARQNIFRQVILSTLLFYRISIYVNRSRREEAEYKSFTED
ncbi:unnamed protein product [Vicia faba]|uniref:Uncharacterized protein n=1 Tax=Vicia faba TaxID=3906 RepID=A0AAV0Z9N6_VICFA|nr:unnamed protein product [Vicia faba]